MTTRKRNYVFGMKIAEQDLAEGKNPPLCDACNNPFNKNDDGVFDVKALVLSNNIWGLVCNDCVEKEWKKLIIPDSEVPLDAKRALHDVLGKEMTVTFLEEEQLF